MRKTLLIIFLLLFLSLVGTSYAQVYQPLAPIPGLTDGENIAGSDKILSTYFQNLYKFGVGVATALALFMVIYGGVEYVSTDAIGGKEEGKERIQNAIFGMILALSSYIILQTIDRSFTRSELGMDTIKVMVDQQVVPGASVDNGQIEPVTTTPIPDNYDETDGVLPTEGPSNSYVALPEGITVKPGSNNQIDLSLISKMTALRDNLNTAGITWTVTEGYPPTRVHKSPCHQNGTCIDANFRGGSTPTVGNVKAFIDSAQKAGMRAVYEVNTKEAYDTLINGGVSPANVKNLGGWISAPHFSVYGY